jgi:lipoate-protein ligase B
MTTLSVLRYGVVPYGQALAHQLDLRRRVQEDPERAGWVVCLQHPPVVTLGKRGKPSDLVSPDLLAERGVELFRVDRGGEATYHGPGQLVIYPIINLDEVGLGVVDLVRSLAASLGDALRETSELQTEYDPEHPGLWTTENPRRKIASVGMRVSRGVSTHGAAINLANDMIPFSWIVACGMPNAPMTRLQDYGDDPVDLDAFADEVLRAFAERIDVRLEDDEQPLPPPSEWVKSMPLPASERAGA